MDLPWTGPWTCLGVRDALPWLALPLPCLALPRRPQLPFPNSQYYYPFYPLSIMLYPFGTK